MGMTVFIQTGSDLTPSAWISLLEDSAELACVPTGESQEDDSPLFDSELHAPDSNFPMPLYNSESRHT